jgi:energy-converting hydrogenase B subunit F
MVFAMAILLIVIIALGIFPDIVTNGISNYVGGMLL